MEIGVETDVELGIETGVWLPSLLKTPSKQKTKLNIKEAYIHARELRFFIIPDNKSKGRNMTIGRRNG